MTTNTGGAVVLLSGGMDSTVLLHFVARSLRRAPIHALSFNYGQRHTRELECGAWQARRVKTADHRTVDVSFLGELVREGTALVSGGADVPDLKDLGEDQLAQPPTYVPNRNMIMLSVAIAWAISSQADSVAYAAHSGDHAIYPDCRPEFAEAMDQAARLCDWRPITLLRPFIDMDKGDIARRGSELGVPFELTWTCYQGGAQHCGRCGACNERKEAFAKHGVPDPTEYEDDSAPARSEAGA